MSYLLRLVLLLPLFLPCPGWGQPALPVKFQSGDQTFPLNVEEAIAAPLLLAEQHLGRYLRFLQFDKIPPATTLTAMRQQGLEIWAYIPHQTYLVSLPVNLDRGLFRAWGVRSVIQPTAREKLSYPLWQSNFPEWALVGNQLEVNLQYLPGTPLSILQSSLRVLETQWIDWNEAEAQLRVRVPLFQLRQLADFPFVLFVEAIPPPPVAEDRAGRGLVRANQLFPEHGNGRHYDGQGVKVLIRDDGAVGPHIDFQGRLAAATAGGPGGGTHGDGVAGVFTGAGNLDPRIQGTAPGATLYVIDHEPTFTDNTLLLHLNEGVLITNTSYSDGCNTGYTLTTQRVDRQMHDNPTLLHVFSAGNLGPLDCGYGAGAGWGNISGGHKAGKNVLTTANLYPGGSLANSSSRGPVSDGRIKPDMAAHGQGQLSTSPQNTYIAFGGTSAAAPSGAGVLAQLYQAYRELNGGTNPESPLIKACVMNTATDLGPPGPDFQYGWGAYHALRAVRLLEETRYFEATLGQGDTNIHSITLPAGVSEARIMLYWLDPEGSPLSAQALVNNLDLQFLETNGQIRYPLVLNSSPDPALLAQAAVPGVDNLNNVEQIRLSAPSTGTYELRVIGKAVPLGPQKYYVLMEYLTDDLTLQFPAGGEGFVPGDSIAIYWDAYSQSDSFSLNYSLDNGQNWSEIQSGLPGDRRFGKWEIPDTVSGQGLVRVSRNGQSSQNAFPFSIIEMAQNLTFDRVCPDTIVLRWDSVPGATHYEVFALGQRYMDSVALTPIPQIKLTGFNPLRENWFSVQAHGANSLRGSRSIAVRQAPGLWNCTVSEDISVRRVVSPQLKPIQLCLNDSIPVSIRIRNDGSIPLDSIPFSFQLDTQPQISELFPGPLLPGDSIDFLFSNKAALNNFANPGGFHNLVVWQQSSSDGNPWNDTAHIQLELLDEVLVPLFQEDFESFPVCGTVANCSGENCSLGNGWLNASNGLDDDIDWRTDAGGTPTGNTGPSIDHAPGTVSGNYLYLESSGGCSNQEAYLLSPCVDLSGTVSPLLTFWYHMEGISMGSLHLDIFDGTSWHNDVIPPVIGNQGTQWQEIQADLSLFAGTLIQLRIRGKTGSGFYSDMAIDDIQFYDLAAPPTVDFRSTLTLLCTGESTQLLPQTSPGVTSWQWQISPATFTYVGGTDSSSQSPQVMFSSPGLYDISLTAATPVSSSQTFSQTAYIKVDDAGLALPMQEDFEGAAFPPLHWRVTNPDQGIGFEAITVLGSAGQTTRAVWVNNANYFPQGNRDALRMPQLDLFATHNAGLSFELAYAPLAANFPDSLLIEISLDCGQTFPDRVYAKTGLTLATAPQASFSWSPSLPIHWRKDSVSLAAYAGQSIVIRFVNVSGYGNNLFLDNILVGGGTVVSAPKAEFTLFPTFVCQQDPFIISDSSQGAFLSYDWDFGSNALPAQSTSPGPHSVVWTTAGMKTISLTVQNAAGLDTYTQQVQVIAPPIAGFTQTSSNGYQYVFSNTSVAGTSYQWKFGDGDTSNFVAPTHTFPANGTYFTTLIAENVCGIDSVSQSVTVTGIGLPQALFAVSDTLTCQDSLVLFTNLSGGIGIDSLVWDFGGQAIPPTALGAGPHLVRFPSEGNYLPQLTVYNAEGSDTYFRNVVVDPQPTATFSYTLGQVPGAVDFQNASTNSQSHVWDFGDGNTSTQANPAHLYTQNGTFSARLIASGKCGVDSFFQTVQISGITAPQAGFTLSGTVVCERSLLVLSDQTQGGTAAHYHWDFGQDAQPSFSNAPGPHSIVYLSPGQKRIILEATNAVGSTADTQFVTVSPRPVAAFASQLQSGQTWQFSNQSQFASQSLWDFADGDTSWQVSPRHTFRANGSYPVQLISTNVCGQDTAMQAIDIVNVSLEAELAGLRLLLYPNPAQQTLVVQFEGEAGAYLELSLWDLKGRSLLSATHLHQGYLSQIKLPVGEPARGVYLLKVMKGKQAIYRRVLLN